MRVTRLETITYSFKLFFCFAGKPKVNPEKAAYDTYCEAIKGLDEINKSLGLWCTYKAALLMKENTGRYS